MLQGMRDEVKQLEELQNEFLERLNLNRLIKTHETFQQTVRALTDQDAIWNSGVPSSTSFAVQVRQRSVEECYEIVRESYAEIQRFSESDHYESTGASFLGWTDKRRYDHKSKAIQYAFTKSFPFEKPEVLLAKTWNMFADGPNMENMSFNGRIRTRYQVLQVVNDDLLIFRRDYKVPGVPTTLVTVQIIFRLQTPTGYTMCMRSIPAPEIQSAFEPHESLHHIFHWTHFNRRYDKAGNPAGCENIAAGSVEDHTQIQSTYWLFDCMCAMIRWESACVAPLFLKQH